MKPMSFSSDHVCLQCNHIGYMDIVVVANTCYYRERKLSNVGS